MSQTTFLQWLMDRQRVSEIDWWIERGSGKTKSGEFQWLMGRDSEGRGRHLNKSNSCGLLPFPATSHVASLQHPLALCIFSALTHPHPLCLLCSCRVVGITLSVEQKAWAEDKVKAQGLQDLITFQLIDYRWALDGSQRF